MKKPYAVTLGAMAALAAALHGCGGGGSSSAITTSDRSRLLPARSVGSTDYPQEAFNVEKPHGPSPQQASAVDSLAYALKPPVIKLDDKLGA